MDKSRLPGYIIHGEPHLLFSATDSAARDKHPLLGLIRHGPYGASQVANVFDTIRVAAVTPHGMLEEVDRLLDELRRRYSPKERTDYLVDYPGFRSVFRVEAVSAIKEAKTELPPDLDDILTRSDRPLHTLADAIARSLMVLRNVRHEFDLVLVLIPARWRYGLQSMEGEDFDLHDYIKAVSASLAIPVQIINDDGALQYQCRCSVMWRLGIALYAKAGGIPWTWADCDPDTAYIGVSYALLDGGRTDRYAICCSQVFNAEGAGLEFVAYEADDVRLYGRNPFLSRSQMLSVMSRSLRIYQRQHGGLPPKRIVVHKNTEFRQDEIGGCMDAFGACQSIELIHVQQDAPWHAVRVLENKKVDSYPCERGSSLQLGDNSVLLWTHGASSEFGPANRRYYKGGKSIPRPLMLVRYAGHGSMDDVCRATMALTKMDWNNDGPYDRLPVTIKYAQTLANVVKRMPKLEPRPYPFRFLM